MTRATKSFSSAIFLALCFALAVAPAYAVVKNLSIVDGQGNSLANTKVTIVFPDGTEVEEETDDDGMLYYDFPEDGNYTVKYPGGQMAVNVKAGGLTTGQWVGAGLATATIIGVGVVASDSGTSSSDSSSSSSDPGGSGGASTSEEACRGGTSNSISGLTTSVVSNPGSHPNNFDGNWNIACDPGVLPRVSYAGPNMLSVEWQCVEGSSEDCVATTDCMYQGFPTTCEISSSFLRDAAAVDRHDDRGRGRQPAGRGADHRHVRHAAVETASFS